MVFGSSVTNSMMRGYLYGAVTFFTWSCSSVTRSSRRLVALREDDRRLDDLAAQLVGHAGDGALEHRRVLHQRALDLERADAVAGALDHVVGAAHEPVVAVLVAPGHVAGVVDAVVPDRCW